MRNLTLCVYLTFLTLCAGEEKQLPTGFTALRGKKPTSNELSDEFINKKAFYDIQDVPNQKIYEEWTPLDDFTPYKRVPSGFFGLRGKKDLDMLIDQTKRIPNSFFGLRGKKFIEDDFDEIEKRLAPSGFWGMRGKRDFDSLYDIKRIPESKFFGLRGKRQPNKNSFFAMRGKKYDIRGKFVGVRGKKSMENDYYDEDLSNNVDLNQLMYFLSQNERN